MDLINRDELLEFPYNETSGTEIQIDDWIFETIDEEVITEYHHQLVALCWKVIEGMLSVIETQPTETGDNKNEL